MTVDEAQHWLQELRQSSRRMNNLRDKIIELRAIVEHITPAYGGNSGGSSGFSTSSKVENGAIAILQTQERLGEEAQRYSRMLSQFYTLSSQMPSAMEALVLEERYINGRGWARICRDLHYTEDGIFKVHRRAVRSIAEVGSNGQ